MSIKFNENSTKNTICEFETQNLSLCNLEIFVNLKESINQNQITIQNNTYNIMNNNNFDVYKTKINLYIFTQYKK